MKNNPNFFTKMGNLTFYNPRSDNLLQDSRSTSAKSQKFFNAVVKKVSSPNIHPSLNNSPTPILNRRQTTMVDDIQQAKTRNEANRLVTKSTFQEDLESSIQKSPTNTVKVVDTSRISKESSKHSRNSPFLGTRSQMEKSDLQSDHPKKREDKSPDDTSIQKIYQSAHEFQTLKIGRDVIEENTRKKLEIDRRTMVSRQLQGIRSDISHLYNPKVSKSICGYEKSIPEIKEEQKQRFFKLFENISSETKSLAESKFLADKSNGGPSEPRQESASPPPSSEFKLLNNTLKESNFLRSSYTQNRSALRQEIRSIQSPFGKSWDEVIDQTIANKETPQESPLKSPDSMHETRFNFNSGEGSPLFQLKKELPTVFSTVPSNRQEILTLGKWLLSSLKGIQDDKRIPAKDKFYKADEIYNICFNELIRQVSIDCTERGELIMLVWKAYLKLAEDIIEDIKAMEEKAEEKHQKEVEKVHAMYDDILKNKEQQMEELRQQLKESENIRKELSHAAKSFDEREAAKIEEIGKLKNYQTKMKKHAQALQVELNDLQYKYQRLQKELNHMEDDGFDEQRIIDQIALRKKNEMELLLSSDSDDDNERPGFGKGQQKIIRYADKSIEYEHPNGFEEIDVQTDLCLMAPKYDRWLSSNEALENIIVEEIAKAKLMIEAEMMENLASPLKRKSARTGDGSSRSDRSDEQFSMNPLYLDALSGLKRNPMGREDEDFLEAERQFEEMMDEEASLVDDINKPWDPKGSLIKNPYSKKYTSIIEEVDEPLESVRPKKEENEAQPKVVVSQNKKISGNNKKINIKGKTQVLSEKAEIVSVMESPKSDRAIKAANDKAKANNGNDNKTIQVKKDMVPIHRNAVKKPAPKKEIITPREEDLMRKSSSSMIRSPSGRDIGPFEPEIQYLNVEGSPVRRFESQGSRNNLKELTQGSSGTREKVKELKLEGDTDISISREPVPGEIDEINFSTSQSQFVQQHSGSRIPSNNSNNMQAQKDECVELDTRLKSEETVKSEGLTDKMDGKMDLIKEVQALDQRKETFLNSDEERKIQVEKPLLNQQVGLNRQMSKTPTGIVEQNAWRRSISPDQQEEAMRNMSPEPSDPAKSRSILKDTASSPSKYSRKDSPNKKITFSKGTLSSIVDDDFAEAIRADEEEQQEKVENKEKKGFKPRGKDIKRASTFMQGSPGTKTMNFDEDPKKVGQYIEHQEQRIIKLMNMYKVERQKQDHLHNANRQLEKQVNDDGALISHLQVMVEDLRKKLELTEQHKDKLSSILKGVEERNKQITIIDESKQYQQQIQPARPQSIGSLQSLDVSKIGASTKKIEVEKFVSKKSRGESSILDAQPQVQIPVQIHHPPQQKVTTILNTQAAAARKHLLVERRQNLGLSTIMRLRTGGKDMQTNDVLAMKAILKQITSFFLEKIQMGKDNHLSKEQDMASFVYKQFLNTYGFQQFALKKFTKFLVSVKKNVSVGRIEKFAKMLGLMEDETQNYTNDETRQYLSGMEFLLTNTSFGTHFPNPDFAPKHYAPYVRAHEFVRMFGERRMKAEDLQIWLRELERFKVPDPTGRNPQGLLEIDEFLDKFVGKYQVMVEQGKETTEDAFYAGDIGGNGTMGYIDFMSLFRNLESERFDEKRVEDLFVGSCDVLVNDEICMSFQKFLAISFELGLFSEGKQNSFLGVTGEEEINKRFEDLKGRWENERDSFNQQMGKVQNIVHPEIFRYWQESLQCIKRELGNQDSMNQKAILLKYKMLYMDIVNIINRLH